MQSFELDTAFDPALNKLDSTLAPQLIYRSPESGEPGQKLTSYNPINKNTHTRRITHPITC
jgi:hypothetical protein